jgi:hypothetical protein
MLSITSTSRLHLLLAVFNYVTGSSSEWGWKRGVLGWRRCSGLWRRVDSQEHINVSVKKHTTYCPEDGNSTFLRNAVIWRVYSASRPRRTSSSWPPWEPHISYEVLGTAVSCSETSKSGFWGLLYLTIELIHKQLELQVSTRRPSIQARNTGQ